MAKKPIYFTDGMGIFRLEGVVRMADLKHLESGESYQAKIDGDTIEGFTAIELPTAEQIRKEVNNVNNYRRNSCGISGLAFKELEKRCSQLVLGIGKKNRKYEKTLRAAVAKLLAKELLPIVATILSAKSWRTNEILPSVPR